MESIQNANQCHPPEQQLATRAHPSAPPARTSRKPAVDTSRSTCTKFPRICWRARVLRSSPMSRCVFMTPDFVVA